MAIAAVASKSSLDKATLSRREAGKQLNPTLRRSFSTPRPSASDCTSCWRPPPAPQVPHFPKPLPTSPNSPTPWRNTKSIRNSRVWHAAQAQREPRNLCRGIGNVRFSFPIILNSWTAIVLQAPSGGGNMLTLVEILSGARCSVHFEKSRVRRVPFSSLVLRVLFSSRRTLQKSECTIYPPVHPQKQLDWDLTSRGIRHNM